MDERAKQTLLQLVHDDALQSHESLSTRLGVSVEEVAQAIRDFEAKGIIMRYGAVVNWDKADSSRVTAVIDVKVTPERGRGFDQIARRIYLFPEVVSVSLMSGTYDLQVIVEGRKIQEVAQFVSEKLSTIENVTSTTTHFRLKTYKFDGVIFDDPTTDQRLVVTP